MKIILRILIIITSGVLPLQSDSQEKSLQSLLSDTSMINASVSLYITNTDNGEPVLEYNSGKSLIPASVMKLITSSCALELLGPSYTFKTCIGYTGTLNKRTGRLSGDIIIKGGGDPVLGSRNFSDHYGDFLTKWVEAIKNAGIKKIDGRIITDDSYYDYQPVPAKWLWEDAGNYYGAGVYGASVFDNTYEIHFKTSSDSSSILIMNTIPKECRYEFSNWLVAAGTEDKGYVFAAPYSTNGWLAGSIPVNKDDFILKAAITDPPFLLAELLDQKLDSSEIVIAGNPTTTRLELSTINENISPITETISPPLKDIIEVLNHESVNLYAEHLIKELGKAIKNRGSTTAGIEVINQFLTDAGINTDGMFIEDGSGLSPLNAINTRELTKLLFYLKKSGRYFNEFYSSMPDAGNEGTLKNYFKDPVFNLKMKAKSGSMTRVRSFAGYFKTLSGKEMVFSIIVNNYTGSPQNIISAIEEIIKETILDKPPTLPISRPDSYRELLRWNRF